MADYESPDRLWAGPQPSTACCPPASEVSSRRYVAQHGIEDRLAPLCYLAGCNPRPVTLWAADPVTHQGRLIGSAAVLAANLSGPALPTGP